MALDPKITLREIYLDPSKKQEFIEHMNMMFYGQKSKPKYYKMSSEEAERIIASLPKDMPLAEIMQSKEYASAVKKHVDDILHGKNRTQTTATQKPVSELTQEEYDRSIDEAIRLANSGRQRELHRQQQLSNRLGAEIETSVGVTRPKTTTVSHTPSTFEALKHHAEHKQVTSKDVIVATALKSALRRAKNESDISHALGNDVGIYTSQPMSDKAFNFYMQYLSSALENGDMDAIHKLQKELYTKYGIKPAPASLHTTPRGSTKQAQTTHRSTEIDAPIVKDKGKPKNGDKPVRSSGGKAAKYISMLLLVIALISALIKCNANANLGDFGIDTNDTETSTSQTGGSISQTPNFDYSKIDIDTLVVDMKDSITMTSQGAISLSSAVFNEMKELCSLANEEVPAALNVPTLTAIMFTENGFKTTEKNANPSDQWVGATQVGIDAIIQQMQRAEKFYYTCLREIEKETDHSVRAQKLEQLKSNYFIKNFYLDNRSAKELFDQCAVDPKLASMAAGSAMLDFAWRYHGSMSQLTDDVSTLRCVAMYNAGEGNVLSNEKGGVINYAKGEGEDVSSAMFIRPGELPSKADFANPDRVAYYFDKFQLSDPRGKGKDVVLQEFVTKTKEMMSYMAKVSSAAEIVEHQMKNNTAYLVDTLLDANNNKIGANENHNPSNFNHYSALDDLYHVIVDTPSFEDYVIGQGQTTDIDLDMIN